MNSYLIWCHGVVVITNAQLHSIKPELRFCTGSNPACSKAKCLSLVNHTTKTIHHHHHHHQREELRKQKVMMWKKAKEGRLIPKKVTKTLVQHTLCNLKPLFLSFLVLNCMGNMCLFIGKKRKKHCV